jgi:hypothetical protein
MGTWTEGGRKALPRTRRDVRSHRSGAVVIAALALTDVAYRMLMREPLRRALGIETRHA